MMGYKAGRECKVYLYNTTAYELLEISKNPELGLAWDEGEVTDFSSDYKRYLKGLADVPLSIEINRNPDNAHYQMLRDAAFSADDTVRLAIAGGDITASGTEYFEAEWCVTSFPISADISGPSTISAELRLAANATIDPDWKVGPA